MIKKYDDIDDKIFFNKNIFMNKNNFLSKFKCRKSSYLYNLYSRLYDYILGNSINLNNEYKKYYKKEFISLDKFLEDRYNLNNEQIKSYNTKFSFYKIKDNGLENSVSNLLYDENIKEIVNNYVGGSVNEY